MNPEELKNLLEEAISNFTKQMNECKSEIDNLKGLSAKQSELEKQYKSFIESGDSDRADEIKSELEELRDEMSDIRSKIKSPVAAITNEDQVKAMQGIAKKAIGAFVKTQDKKADFNKFIADNAATQLKTLNITTPEAGGLAVAEVLSRDVIEYARELSPILRQVGYRSDLTRDYREMVLISYPSTQEGIENVAGTKIQETTTQEYTEVKTKVFKINAKPRITDEAMNAPDVNIYAQLVKLLGEEMRIKLSANILYGAGDADKKTARGILSSKRVDITDGTGESFKPTLDVDTNKMRKPDFYPVLPSGVLGKLGSSDKAVIDYLIDVIAALPSQYLSGAKWHFNRKTLATLRKIRNSNEDPVLLRTFMENSTSILGYPYEIDDTLPDIADDSTPIIFGNLSLAYSYNDGDINKMLLDPYSVDGCTVIKTDKEYFEMVGNSDAILVCAATANSGT